MNRIIGAVLMGAGCVAMTAIGRAAPEPPPGGSAWVRWDVDAVGKPPGYLQYEDYCSACHDKGPEQRPGYQALLAKYHGTKPAWLPDRTDLTPALIRFVVRHGITVMPTFRKTEVSDANLDLIIQYLTRNNPHVNHGAKP